MQNNQPWYVITGGPYAGKTTLIGELENRGYNVVPEMARTVIDEGLNQGKTLSDIRKDEGLFQKVVLDRKIEVEKTTPKDTITFFDRGMPDSLAYYRANNIPENRELVEACERSKYRKVFLLELLGFQNDEVRNESPELATKIQKELFRCYQELGCEIIRVPVLPLTERVAYILNNL